VISEKQSRGKKMSKNKFLTPNQIALTIVGFFIGSEFILFPRLLTKFAHQDGWISVLIGMIYPAYLVFISIYIAKNYPDTNLLNLNKRFFGKFLGTLLNVIYGLQFFMYPAVNMVRFGAMIRTNLTFFLTPLKIYAFCLAAAFYAAYKGLRVLGKFNEFFYYFFMSVFITSFIVLKDGKMINLFPVLGSGFGNIINGTWQTLFIFTGFEVILMLHPYATDIKKIKASSLKALGICTFILVSSTIVCILYLGPDIASKPQWPFLFIVNSIDIGIANNLKPIFLLLWIIFGLKTLANYIYLSSTIASELTNMDYKLTCILFTLLSFGFSFIFNSIRAQDIINSFTTVFHIPYIIILYTTLAIFCALKKETETN
jgi:spore germination protein (amino acid permease)